MKKLLVLCFVFVFSNIFFAQNAKETTSKAKTEKTIAVKKAKDNQLKEEKAAVKKEALKSKKDANKAIAKTDKTVKVKADKAIAKVEVKTSKIPEGYSKGRKLKN